MGGIYDSNNELEHFNADENKRLSNTFKSLGANNPKRLGEILTRAIRSVTKQRDKSKEIEHGRI